jgi:hypothetical protein
MHEQSRPVYLLKARLERARLEAVEALEKKADSFEALPDNLLRRVNDVQIALMAVQDEIERHLPHVGSGGERPMT